MIELRLLGGLELTANGRAVTGRGAQRHRLALLAILGASCSEPVSREKITAALWPDGGPLGRHRLSNSIHMIRKALAADAILGTADALQLNPERVRCDVREFRSALARGDLAGAVALYRGPFLDGFFLAETNGFEAWVDEEREQNARAHARALEMLAGECEAAGDYHAAGEWWRRLVAADPLAARTVLRAMRALEAANEVEEALLCGRAYESRVRAELDVEPDRDVVRFAERLVRERRWPPGSGAAASKDTPTPPVAESIQPHGTGGGGGNHGAVHEPTASRRRLIARAAVVLLIGIVILTVLRLGPDRAHRNPSAGAGTRNLAASDQYRRCTDPVHLRSKAGVREALECMQRVTDLDPGFAAAHAMTGRFALVLRGRERRPSPSRRELFSLAEREALLAVALDGSLAEGHAVLGLVRWQTLDLDSTEVELRRAVALAPTEGLWREWLSDLYIWRGRPLEALREAERSLRLKPLSPQARAEVARALLVGGRCEEALEHLALLADLDPPLKRAGPIAAQCHANAGRWQEALAWLDQLEEEDAGERDPLRGYVYARAGMEVKALRIHERLLDDYRQGKGDALGLAISCAGLGKTGEAVAWLQRSIDQETLPGPLTTVIMEPVFAEVRRDPGFERVARQLGIQNW